MAIGSIINLGGGGGSSSGGKGIIICDTSTFSVGDTIRVRDVYDSQNVQNKQVITVGTPVIFEVDWGCYYKICTVQTIDDTPTEIGGVYKSVDYGQTIFIDVLDKKTLAAHQGILNAHNENYEINIGDEVTIKTSYGGSPTDWIMQVANIDGTNHIIDYVSKDILTRSVPTDANQVYYTSNTAPLRTIMQNFYASIDSRDKQFLKQATLSCCIEGGLLYTTFSDYVYPCNRTNIDGIVSGTPPIARSQFALFTTQANRIKTYNGNASGWWTCDGAYNDSASMIKVRSVGDVANDSRTYQEGVVPCFRLTADS